MKKPFNQYEGIDNLRAMQAATHYNGWLERRISRLLKMRGPDAVVVDFGAGLGDMAKALSRRHPNQTFVCIEPDPLMRGALLHRKEPHLTAIEQLNTVVGNSIDVVYTLNVLEHIREDVDTLRQIRRVLKPGGIAIIYVPAFPVLFSAMDRKVGHWRRYRHDVLLGRIRAAGLVRQSARYVDCLGFFAALAYRRMHGNGDLSPQAMAVYDRWIWPVSCVLDWIFSPFFGKNLWMVVVKPTPGSRRIHEPCRAVTPKSRPAFQPLVSQP
ncbi:MAG: class I SAM-dependent methyltransferase [Sinobacteraceae bacterium]|nr:class I SAM-dependent methyltransferase [Nevskiaceae bacterium]